MSLVPRVVLPQPGGSWRDGPAPGEQERQGATLMEAAQPGDVLQARGASHPVGPGAERGPLCALSSTHFCLRESWVQVPRPQADDRSHLRAASPRAPLLESQAWVKERTLCVPGLERFPAAPHLGRRVLHVPPPWKDAVHQVGLPGGDGC